VRKETRFGPTSRDPDGESRRERVHNQHMANEDLENLRTLRSEDGRALRPQRLQDPQLRVACV